MLCARVDTLAQTLSHGRLRRIAADDAKPLAASMFHIGDYMYVGSREDEGEGATGGLQSGRRPDARRF